MSTRDTLSAILKRMPEERLGEVLGFALFVSGRGERAAWRDLSLEGLARAYGADEPEIRPAVSSLLVRRGAFGDNAWRGGGEDQECPDTHEQEGRCRTNRPARADAIS